ncbi:MAG: SDR family oxidoreductase [Gemmatimonadetes bacterium]|uniref:SDR family oxidoreductase n=1 Tax=Candidatus Kutchimonas denitrificans TaxID=3056748 RepID=A0AAE4ZA44_9BACT|nr:SDR family oxidoreductase [Gemmatimonadota bacterium]NIR75477.1 SDR family oxidoreductase [Candidatus Kutchimonas denitrificans]NIS01791.1 SDR family oxidoreductase [Gemmatimonadota bacterium]NIT67572.1 SDR family oxidoreductase [Gemmatimonadota bacterium]NIU53446.1 SDR family NAD(P)-dependent oxidoreductase [Gemmatimonadota bacterium]
MVLTGATGGVGRAVADRLARGGARLALIARGAAELQELAERLDAAALSGDLTDRDFIAAAPGSLSDALGGTPDVVINNAGAFAVAPFVDTEPETFERMLAVNVRAPFELTRALLPDMLRRGRGHLVSVGSVAGRTAFPGNAAYSASKFGLYGLHRVLVEELRDSGLKATWIEPSAVDTPLWNPLEPDQRPDLPSRSEMLRPEAVADAIEFVLSRPENVNIEELVIRANSARVGDGERVAEE